MRPHLEIISEEFSQFSQMWHREPPLYECSIKQPNKVIGAALSGQLLTDLNDKAHVRDG